MNDKSHVKRRHNVTMLLYHLVLPSKYRRKVFSENIYRSLVEVCTWIEERYEIMFLEIWNDEDHIHFMIQWVPKMLVTKIVTIIKSVTARQLMKVHPEIRKILWWWNVWTSWYYVNSVWAFAWEQTIGNYIRNQWITKYEVWYEKNLKEGLIPLFLMGG